MSGNVSLANAPYLLLADGHVLRSYDMSRDTNGRLSFMSYVSSVSRIDSVSVDLVGERWTAFMLSYHSKSILKADITALRQNVGKRLARSKRQSSTAVKPQAMSLPEVIVSTPLLFYSS